MSGNYQSRVFTFINKRTSRFKDTCAQGFRHIKVAVVWSGQALLYPFHLLAQTTKLFQPQITPPAESPVLAPVSDINIEQALELVVDAGYPIVIAERGSVTVADSWGGSRQQSVTTSSRAIVVSADSSNLGYYDSDTDDWEIASYSPRRSQQVVTKKPIIQGLSSLLIDRQLVLVTTENEILDILTSSQQQEIRRRIGSDLAIEWYQWSTGEILVGGASLFSSGRGSANAERLPIPDGRLSPTQKENRHSPAQLVGTQQLSLTTGSDRPQLAIASGEDRSPNLLDRFQDWLQNLTVKSSSTTESSDINLDRITSELPRQIAPASYDFTPQPPRIDRFLDLPQLPPIHESESLIAPTNPIQQKLIEFRPEWLKSWWSYYREYLSIPATDFDEFERGQLIHQPAEFQLTRIEERGESSISHLASGDRSIVHDGSRISEVTHNQHQSRQSSGKLDRRIFQNVEHNPDWIETEAEQIGYSRSPIAQLLEWIDRLFLQVENWLIKIWNMITNSQSEI